MLCEPLKRSARPRFLLALVLMALLASSLWPAPLCAADGDLDPGFGSGGVVTTDFLRGGEDNATAMALQKDGKIVVAGGNSGSFAVARYNPDGSLDATFDGDGKVITDFDQFEDTVNGLALQPDGRIVAAGLISSHFGVARYEPDGSLDSTFGQGGISVISFGERASAVALQPDGKVIVVGWSLINSFEFVIARYNPDGSPDASFGNGGIVTTDPGGDFEAARAVALQPDGKIVVAGGNQFFFLHARYNTDGSLDTSFGGVGFVFTQFSDAGGASAFGVAVQPTDGKIVTAGSFRSNDSNPDFGLARYNPDGSLDSSFDGDGKVITDWEGGSDMGNAMVIQPDGKILVAGRAVNDFALARYNPDGSLDTSFGNGGRVITDFSNTVDKAQAVALQPDGKILVAGVSSVAFGFLNDFALVRYNPDGSLDTSFDLDGKAITDVVDNNDDARAVAVQNDGKIVVAGGSLFSFALVRYNPDGSLDTSFDGDGKVITNFSMIGSGASASDIVIQPGDGKIIAAGDLGFNFALLRYNPDGSLDPSFDGDGIVTTVFKGFSRAQSVVLQPDGRIVAAGFTQPSPVQGSGMGDFALARYNSDGSLDTTFDGDGMVTTNMSVVGDDDQAHGVAVQPLDGKIVAVGYARNGIPPSASFDFALARYNPDGSLDTSFGGDGTVSTNIGNTATAIDRAAAVAIQPGDGKIIAAGESLNVGTGVDFALARYGDAVTTPPEIACPAGIQAVTARPREACAVVNYQLPQAAPGVTVACAPPPGSCFPAGTTTVTCTATDAAGNTASCSFTVTVFDVLLRSDSDPAAELLINSFTGDYSFCCPALPQGQSPLRGRGEVHTRGGAITLTHMAPGYRLQATVDSAVGKGTASLKPLSGALICPIQDRNIFNNLPVRCGNPSP